MIISLPSFSFSLGDFVVVVVGDHLDPVVDEFITIQKGNSHIPCSRINGKYFWFIFWHGFYDVRMF